MPRPKMTPRKFAKLPWIRESVGGWCEEVHVELHKRQLDDAVAALPLSPGDIVSVSSRAAEFDLISEQVSSRGVIERRLAKGRVVHGELSDIPREDGFAYPAIAAVVPRPYGRRHDILEYVQAQIRRKQGVTMSLEWIANCWDDFRALENSLRSEKE
jgi:hypothetical protein